QEIANKALPSTVLLETEDSNGQSLGFGSGFFVQENEIATNFHVVEGAHKCSVKLFGQSERYTIEEYTAIDVDNDLIILKIKDPDQKIVSTRALSLGDSDIVDIGEVIYALGNPEGLEGTISDGIVSGIRNRDPSQNIFYTSIQFTAPISPGSSGGAVLNTKGDVIGVSVSVLPSLRSVASQNPQDEQYINVAQNLNFAIPSNCLALLLRQRNKLNITTPLSKAKLERVTYINNLKWIGSASFTFPLQNRSSTDVKNVVYSVSFKDKEGNTIITDRAVYPWVIPSKSTKIVIRLSGYDTVDLQLVDNFNIQLLQNLGAIDYDESDINDNATESVLIGLVDMLLSNMGHSNYSTVKPNVKRLTNNHHIHILDLEVVN
ncbi:MAG: S1C family serine protease, partial [Candidatus Poribacteria bacterium]|nr:S1C family serine protease [Candidatus Poribacteria bacterium]